MKKALCVILVFVLVFVSNFNMVIAAENIQFDDPSSLIVDYELSQRYWETGGRILSSPQPRFTVSLNIKRINQADSEWGNLIMQKAGLTIGAAGCTLTSSTMIAKYYGYDSYTPATFNTALGNNACPLIYNQAAKLMGKTAGVKLANDDKETDDIPIDDVKQLIIGSIDDKVPVLVRMVKSNGDSHYVVANGYATGTTPTIFIADPLEAHSTLEAYLNKGYSVHWIMVYE